MSIHAPHAREVVRVGLSGVGSVAAVVISGDAWAAVPGALAGLLAAFAVEWIASLRAELDRLRELERTVEDERRQRAYELDLLRQRTEAAERNFVVSETWMKVWGDAYTEAAKSGRILPVEVLMARADVTLKAKGIHPAPQGDGPGTS
jgi:hypothetical protein